MYAALLIVHRAEHANSTLPSQKNKEVNTSTLRRGAPDDVRTPTSLKKVCEGTVDYNVVAGMRDFFFLKSEIENKRAIKYRKSDNEARKQE